MLAYVTLEHLRGTVLLRASSELEGGIGEWGMFFNVVEGSDLELGRQTCLS